MMHTTDRRVRSLASPAVLCLMMACGNVTRSGEKGGEQQQSPAPDPQTAAQQSLATLRQLVTEANYRDLGFETAREVREATLGQPIPVVFVRLDQLRAYQAGGNPEALLSSFEQVDFPVLVGQAVRTSVVVQRQRDGWRTLSMGNGTLAKQIAQRRAPAAGDSAAREVLVHVGALGVYFVGHRVANRLMLTPLTSHADLQVRAGVTEPADSVFAKLVPAARRVRNDAPI